MVKRFTLAIAIAIILSVLGVARAEQAPGRFRIGILVPELGPSESQTVKGLRDRLKELGYKEGESIQLEMRDVKGDRGALTLAAMDLVSRNVNVIFTTGTRAAQAAKNATKKIPVVFSHDADPVDLGLIKSMKQPGGNLTGVAGLSLQMTEKRLEILKEIFPNLRRLHIFYDPNNIVSQRNFAFVQKAAAAGGLIVVEHTIKTTEELKTAIAGLYKGEGDALLHVPDSLVESQVDFVFDALRQKGLPSMTYEEIGVVKGALAGYGVNDYEMGRQAAQLVDRILKGTNPKNLPVEPGRKFDLVINLRTASVIGVTIPPPVLKKAGRIIR